VFEIGATTVTIAQLTMSGGVASADAGFHGGNLRNQSGIVTLDHVRVTDGRAFSGGGVANRNGTMLIQHSLIDHNFAMDGGGDGGGVINFGGDGGAPATLVVRDTTIAFNTARLAGGLIGYDNPGDSVTFEGVTLARNLATDRGIGGVSVAPGGFQARGSIFSDNASDAGPSNCGTVPVNNGGNIDSVGDCGLGAAVSPGLATDLTDSGGQTDVLPFALPSPAHDVGGVCSALDQTDAARPQGAGCDAGAWEYREAAPPPPPPPPPPIPTPTPTATPVPTPVANRTVVVAPARGRVLVKERGSNRFVPLTARDGIPIGSTVDTRKGTVALSARAGGKVETAEFRDGIFRVSQSRGITTLTLTEQLASCSSRARAAQKKPKTRKLWGDGKGKFRTRGSFSSATVRGTKWVVIDRCDGTLTRVLRGSVTVRDRVRGRTVIVRAGKQYLARKTK